DTVILPYVPISNANHPLSYAIAERMKRLCGDNSSHFEDGEAVIKILHIVDRMLSAADRAVTTIITDERINRDLYHSQLDLEECNCEGNLLL
ncbi:MAG: hypothetical protein JW795_07315, partial [Chitinivibrionales bacterium]|nr:hypothetical protein [Chitinivibrionales bacterium]